MIDELKKFRTNWVDGMKISKEHFKDIQDYSRDVGKDVTSIFLNDINYGVLPTSLSHNIKYNIDLNAHNSINITIQKLSAVTINGARVEINSTTSDVEYILPIEEINKKNLEEAYIVLRISPTQDDAFGKQNLDEVPPRLPYVNNKFVFSIVSKDEMDSSGLVPFQLPIAKIKKAQGSLEIVDNYVPPCVKILSDIRLVEFYNYTSSFLSKMEKNAIKIVKKIREESNRNPIADVVQEMSAQMLSFLGSEIIALEAKRHHNTPKRVVNAIMSMARILKNHIDTYSPNIKESLFLYFGEWVDIKGGDFEKLFSKTININYTHYDLYYSVKDASDFITTIEKLFEILTEIDYIGKKKDTGLFVNENKVIQNKSDAPPSFLAD